MKFKKAMIYLSKYVYITLGALIGALGMNIFLVPNRIAPGGISGLATIVYYLAGKAVPIGILILIFNLPLFVIGFIMLGKHFIIRTAFGTTVFSLAIDLTAPYINDFASTFIQSGGETDMMLFSIFGGGIMGLGLGIIFRMRSTTGGVDLLAEILIRKGSRLSMGQTMLVFDAIIVIIAGIIFQSILIALYTIVCILVFSKVVDTILDGLEVAKGLFIISDKSKEISDEIIRVLDRGVTGLKGTGKYTSTEKEVLFSIVGPREIPLMKRVIKEIDPKAFVVVTDVHEVLGEGFKGFDNKII
jgi:uncharacterized membrane-anchored protein YitT (DUF2179 family)